MSTSPRFNAASRVVSSGVTLKIRRFTFGGLRQYWSKASKTSSMPGVNETNLYGPAPMGAFLNPSSPTFSTYFLGTIQWSARLGEFFHCFDKLVAVRFVQSDGQGEHAAFGEPDAAREEIEIEEVTQCAVAAFSVFL